MLREDAVFPVSETLGRHAYLFETRMGALYSVWSETGDEKNLLVLTEGPADTDLDTFVAGLKEYYQLAAPRFFLTLQKCVANRSRNGAFDMRLFFDFALPLCSCMEKGGLPEAEIVNLGIHISTALKSCHKRGFTHGSVVPQEIYRLPDGNWMLSAPLMHSTFYRHFIQRKVQRRFPYDITAHAEDDVVALGRLLYELCAKGRSVGSYLRPPEGTTPELGAVVSRASSGGSAGYASVGQFCDALKDVREQLETPTLVYRPPETIPPFAREAVPPPEDEPDIGAVIAREVSEMLEP